MFPQPHKFIVYFLHYFDLTLDGVYGHQIQIIIKFVNYHEMDSIENFWKSKKH